MSDVQGVSGRRHFSPDEEAGLRESTSSIVRRDTKLAVDIQAEDLRWHEVKHHQQGLSDNKVGMAEPFLKVFEGAVRTGLMEALEHAVVATRVAHAVEVGAVALEVAAPIATLALGLHELVEAHEKGHQQADALAKDAAHVALIGALDLPATYKNQRIDVDYEHVPFDFNKPAYRAMEGLMSDKKGLATLQLRADSGMTAARDLLACGTTSAAFMKQNPRVFESLVSDPAFREGFQGFLAAKATMPKAQMAEFEARLGARDGWSAQRQIHIRM